MTRDESRSPDARGDAGELPPPAAAAGDTDGAAPPLTGAGPQRLHPNIRPAWMISSLLVTLVLGGLATWGDLGFLSDEVDGYPLPPGVACGLVWAVLLFITFGMPRHWYSHWSYEVREDDVLICQGVLWQSRKSVPRLRIQHVDVELDPLDRLFGLASVTLYTAGTGGGDAEIPGLTPPRAEALREELLIRRDAAADGAAHLDAVVPPREAAP